MAPAIIPSADARLLVQWASRQRQQWTHIGPELCSFRNLGTVIICNDTLAIAAAGCRCGVRALSPQLGFVGLHGAP